MTALPHNPARPRAGDWPAPCDAEWDVVLLGAPASTTSLSPTGAHATPAAVRAALPRYGATLIGPAPIDLGAVLRIADAGDVADPDGPAGESALRGRVRDLSARSDLVVALCVLELLSAVHLRKDSRA